MSKATEAPTGPGAAKEFDELVERLGGWRSDRSAQVRQLIHQAMPDGPGHKTWRAIDPREADALDAASFQALVSAAASHNAE